MSEPDTEAITIAHGSGFVRFSTVVLEELRGLCVENFLAIPRGGLEVGGVLYGVKSADEIEVIRFRSLAIEHRFGPSFTLSPNDELSLTEMINEASPTEHDRPLEVVGWWHSHTRTEVEITDEDLRVHRQTFLAPDQIALIVKPFKSDPAQAAVYLPNMYGSAACGTFSVGLSAEKSPVEGIPPDPPVSDSPIEIDTPRNDAVPAGGPLISLNPARSLMGRRIALAMLVATACLSAFLYSSARKTPPADPIQLHLAGVGDQLLVRWDRETAALSNVAEAELLILEGGNVSTIPLTAENLGTGTVSYIRKTGKVEVRIRTRSRSNELYEAVGHFIGPEPTVARGPATGEEVQNLKAELTKLNSELQQARTADKRNELVVRRPSTEPSESPQRRSLPVLKIPSAASSSPVNQPQLPAPPQIPAGLVAQQPAPPALSLPRPNAAAPPVNSARRLASGRAIWTGALPRGSVLLLDRGRANIGTLTGVMPDGPSRFRALPAELTEFGVIVYASGIKERVEPPSAGNGWNVTTFRSDPKHAQDIVVVEPLSQSNGWRRVIIRSEKRTVPMVIFEWEELSPSGN